MGAVADLVISSNELLTFAPYVAGVIAALVVRTVDARVRWLVLAGCLLPLVSAFATRLFYGFFFASARHSDDVLNRVYAVVGVSTVVLGIASVLLLVLAVAVKLRASRTPGRHGS